MSILMSLQGAPREVFLKLTGKKVIVCFKLFFQESSFELAESISVGVRNGLGFLMGLLGMSDPARTHSCIT